MVTRTHYIITFLILLLSSACGIKRGIVYDFSVKKADIPIFIEIPKSDLVFENVSPLVYDVFSDHFERVGYHLMTRSSDGYTLCISIKNLDPIYKYVSPDVVLFHATIKLELYCQLFNFAHEMITQKSFTFSTLISKPQNPILNSDFLDFSYTRLLKTAAPKVEQYFRPFLLKSAD